MKKKPQGVARYLHFLEVSLGFLCDSEQKNIEEFSIDQIRAHIGTHKRKRDVETGSYFHDKLPFTYATGIAILQVKMYCPLVYRLLAVHAENWNETDQTLTAAFQLAFANNTLPLVNVLLKKLTPAAFPPLFVFACLQKFIQYSYNSDDTAVLARLAEYLGTPDQLYVYPITLGMHNQSRHLLDLACTKHNFAFVSYILHQPGLEYNSPPTSSFIRQGRLVHRLIAVDVTIICLLHTNNVDFYARVLQCIPEKLIPSIRSLYLHDERDIGVTVSWCKTILHFCQTRQYVNIDIPQRYLRNALQAMDQKQTEEWCAFFQQHNMILLVPVLFTGREECIRVITNNNELFTRCVQPEEFIWGVERFSLHFEYLLQLLTREQITTVFVQLLAGRERYWEAGFLWNTLSLFFDRVDMNDEMTVSVLRIMNKIRPCSVSMTMRILANVQSRHVEALPETSFVRRNAEALLSGDYLRILQVLVEKDIGPAHI